MAVLVKEIWVDDVDGTEADRTVRFTVDKNEYTIDLSEQNYERLKEALEPYMAAGRRIPKPRAKRKRG